MSAELVMPTALVDESYTHPDKRQVFEHMVWLRNTADEGRRFAFWKQYILDRHPDKHPERDAPELKETFIHMAECVDFAKRLKPWLVHP